MAGDNNNGKRTLLFAIITALFFFWGLANNLTGVLQETFGRIMDIGGWQTLLIESAFYAAYFIFAIPATYFIFRYSYKNSVILGLTLYSVGAMLFFPASNVGSPYFYIIAIYVLAGGCTVLETVANPYILSLGRNYGDSVFKLNLAQAFNPLGSITGILVGQALIMNNLIFEGADTNPEIMHEQLDAITMLYCVIGEVLMVFLVALLFISMPVEGSLAFEGRRTLLNLRESLFRVLRSRRFRGGVVAQFMYVGAQTGVWGYITKVSENIDGVGPHAATSVFVWAMVAFGVARFVFTYLMRSIHYHNLLLWAAASAVVLCMVVIFGGGYFVVVSLVLISAMMSLMFPTIFGAALEKAGSDMQAGSSLLIMSIAGGAFIMPLQNYISDSNGAQMSFIVPAFCFMAIAAFALGLILTEKKK